MIRIIYICTLLQPIICIIVKDPPNLKYKYSYNIADPTTGDTKNLQEEQIGDVVSGSYSILDPDGSRRTVHYTAGPSTGFKAIVETESLGGNVFNYPPSQGQFGGLHTSVYSQPVLVIHQGGFDYSFSNYFIPIQMSDVALKRVLGSELKVYKYFLPVRFKTI